MDNALLQHAEVVSKPVDFKLKVISSKKLLHSLKPIEPKLPIITLVPKYVPHIRKHTKCLIRKPKEPKFIPYEPYKGAIEPIISRKKVVKPEMCARIRKNNIDIHDLVTQISEVRLNELKSVQVEVSDNEETFVSRKQWEEEKRAYETDINNLRETNAHLENNLKFQAQVRSFF